MADPHHPADGPLTVVPRTMPPAAAALLASAIALAGCSNPKAASEANFRKVLEPMVANAFCREIQPLRLETLETGGKATPVYPIVLAAKPGMYEQAVGMAARRMLDEASAEGLVRRTPAVVMGRSSQSDPFVRMEALSYMPTPMGRAVFRTISRKAYDGSVADVPAVCIAKGAVDQIVRWTDPAEVFGRTLTTVTYTVVAKNVVDAAQPSDRAKLARPVERTVTLQRTSDGWGILDTR